MDDARRAARGPRATASPPRRGLTAIGTEPKFAIGQRALLVPTASGNVLWDCVTLLDDDTAEEIKRRGGLAAIAISHPHYYSAMVDWAQAFGCPVYLHADDAEWVMRPDPVVELWDGETLGPRRRAHADPLRRALRGRHGAALGGRRRRPRRAADR